MVTEGIATNRMAHERSRPLFRFGSRAEDQGKRVRGGHDVAGSQQACELKGRILITGIWFGFLNDRRTQCVTP